MKIKDELKNIREADLLSMDPRDIGKKISTYATGKYKEAINTATPSEEISDKMSFNKVNVNLIDKLTKDNPHTMHVAKDVTRTEKQKREGLAPKAYDKVDLEARKKIIDQGGVAKAAPDNELLKHLSNNKLAYGGAAAAGLGAYGLYKYLKNRKKRKTE